MQVTEVVMSEYAIRGRIFHTVANPKTEANAWQYFDDGVMVVSDGRVKFIEEASKCLDSLREKLPITEYPNCLICPGFIDTHIHYAQTRIIGCPAPGLLEWLDTYTFPEELRFSDPEYSSQVAVEFFDELAANGTTTAQVYPTVHENSADLFFEEAHNRGLRMVAGKVLMDRNAPDGLQDGDGHGEIETERLIGKWHGKDRQTYSITLRFAGTSTHQQMQICGQLVQRYPDLLFHTHLSETKAEIEWTLELFPDFSDYLSVYEGYGVLSDRSVFAHCIHLSESEQQRLSDAGAAIAMCPTSNLFLGSGLVPMNNLTERDINLSLGTDVGGGTSFSMLQTMHEMYKVAKIEGSYANPVELFYLATLGGARTLHIDQHVGSFENGKEADYVVLDSGGRNLTQQKLSQATSVEELLFAFIILGGVANVRETWSMGKRIFQRPSS